jgi:hypothetical protein
MPLPGCEQSNAPTNWCALVIDALPAHGRCSVARIEIKVVLPAPLRPERAEDLALANIEASVGQRFNCAIALAECLDAQGDLSLAQ